MTTEKLKEFFKDRPSLAPSAIGKEAGMSSRIIAYVLIGEVNLTSKIEKKLLPVLKKYGYK